MTISRNGFQTFVNRDPAPGVIGAFASMNPRATVLAGAGALRSTSALDFQGNVANPIVGRWAWGQGLYASRQKPAGVSVGGFVAYELQTAIPFLAPGAGANPTQMAVQSGFPITLYSRVDAWALPESPVGGAVAAGDTVYARQYDGALSDDPVAFEGTASQATNVLTVSAVAKGFLVPGMVVDSSGADTTVLAQLTGTPGGVGTYTVSNSATVGSGTVTVAAEDTGFKWLTSTTVDAVTSSATTIAAGTGVMTVAAMASGTIEVGQNVSGTGVPVNLFVVAQLTGTPGGAGTYQLNSIGPAVAAFTATLSQGKLAKIGRAL